MWFRYWIIIFTICSLVTAKEVDKPVVESETDSKVSNEEENQDEVDPTTEKVETFSADINFNSWSELYDYLKEIEEATSEDDEETVEPGVRLQLMTDGDALTLEGDNNEEGDPVVVHGTISDVIQEVPAPDLSQNEVIIGDEDGAQKSDKPRIITTKADWTFIQHTLKKLDEKEALVTTKSKQDEESDEELTEDERKGKEIFEKSKQITTLTRANRKLVYNMFVEAAELGYIPAKEQVAWSQLLGSNSIEELPIAKKSFEELANIGRPDSQMVDFYSVFIKDWHLINLFIPLIRPWDFCMLLDLVVWNLMLRKPSFITPLVPLEDRRGLKWL